MKGKVTSSLLLFTVCVILSLIPARSSQAIASAVVLSTEKLTMTVGDTETIEMLVGGTPCSASGWTSNKKSVATVTGKGVVKAKKAGTAVITCKTGFGYNLKCKVTVKKAATVKLEKYLNKSCKTLVKKVPEALKLSAGEDPAGMGNVYVFKTATSGTSLFIRYNTSTMKITTLQNSYVKNLSLYGVKLGMKKSAAKSALKKNGWTYAGKAASGSGYKLQYKKSGHTIWVVLENGKVTCYQWVR